MTKLRQIYIKCRSPQEPPGRSTGRGSSLEEDLDLKLVQGPPGPCDLRRSESEEVECVGWHISVAVAGAQRLLELAVARHSPHSAGELRASVGCDEGGGGVAGDPTTDDGVCTGLGRGGDRWDGLNPTGRPVLNREKVRVPLL
jgi:hypothetical protein